MHRGFRRLAGVVGMAALAAFSGVSQAQAGFPAPPGLPAPPLPGNVNVRVEGFFPAPPGVHIYYADERPYYVRGGRRVYLERDPHYRGHGHKKGHYKDKHEHKHKHGH